MLVFKILKQVKQFTAAQLEQDSALYCEVYDDNYNKSFVLGYGVANNSGVYFINADHLSVLLIDKQ